MAASRMGILLGNKRFRIFIYLALFTIAMQLFLAYNFYTMNQSELRKIRNLENDRRQKGGILSNDYKNLKFETPLLHEGADDKLNLATRISRKNAENKLLRKYNNQTSQQNFKKAVVLEKNKSSKEVEYKCDIQASEAKSALSRAKTDECKKEIADIVCAHETKNIFAENLPRYCSLKGQNAGEYIGCFSDSRSQRLLGSVSEEFQTGNTPDKCVQFCYTAGTKYAGVQYGYECYCGDSVNEEARLKEIKCNHPCVGNPAINCGGYLTINVYSTGVGDKPNNPAPLIRELEEGDVPVKIVFVLTVNGRAVRQVKRLLKMLYASQHYFYIHVDKRQEYLYRELLPLMDKFSNIHVTSNRLSTIWGGASLLSLHLNCMKELLTFKHWNWDYLINLSESDFPIKPINELVAYLTKNQGMNFLRAHGTNTPKFIKKQGLDKVFVECDTHMWRVGSRHVPYKIVMSGGSDWFSLHRNFVHYIINSEDSLMTGLKYYYKYALLPSESFFHTVIMNSEFCTTFVDNNLHMTNWNRKQGCKCQYKHIVDWCGCSPNDFLPHDYNKIMSSKSHPTFFARKFEAIVSQDIVTAVEKFVLGNQAKDDVAMHTFWLNEYHHLDLNTPQSFMTYYYSFIRRALTSLPKLAQNTECNFTFKKLLQVHVFSQKDTIQGFLVQFSASSGTNKQHVIEILVQPKEPFKLLGQSGPTSRLKYLQVGTSWDPKEEIFRNYGKFLCPATRFTMAIHWRQADNENQDEFSISAVYIDPAMTIAASYDITVKPRDRVTTHTPDFKKPLRPGNWTVRLLYKWKTIAETSFMIIPITHLTHNTTLSDTETQLLHKGPTDGTYVDKDFKNFFNVLKIKEFDASVAKIKADLNAKKVGPDLWKWVDSLTASNYRLGEACLDEAFSYCGNIPVCTLTKWSSLSPDPKSNMTLLEQPRNSS